MPLTEVARVTLKAWLLLSRVPLETVSAPPTVASPPSMAVAAARKGQIIVAHPLHRLSRPIVNYRVPLAEALSVVIPELPPI